MNSNLRLLCPEQASAWSVDDVKKLASQNRRLAMEMTIRKFRQPLFYHALYIVKDGQEAYDVVQEVFIRAMRESRIFDEDFKVKAWLFRVTSNLCFNLVRDRKRRRGILEAMPPPTEASADQVDRVLEGERRQEVLAAIGQVSDDHKAILLLRYYDDLSYAEIADVLEIKLGTVMSRLSRARCSLQAVMVKREEATPPSN